MISERLLNALTAIGFTKNEAKTYAALLEEAPATGYAIAKRAGITRARTYDALEQMVNKQTVRMIPGSPVLYEPIPIEEITQRQQQQEEEDILNAEVLLSAIKQKNPAQDSLINIVGYNTIMAGVMNAIESSRERISLFVREEEYAILKEPLRAAAERGVKIRAVFAVDREVDCDFMDDVTYVERLHSMQARMGNRWLILTVDSKVGYVGLVSHGEQSIAVSTKNRDYISFIIANTSSYFIQRDLLRVDASYRFISPMHSKYEELRKRLVNIEQ